MPANITLTSELFWQCSLIAAAEDGALIVVIRRLIPADLFFHLRRPLVVSAGIFWGALGISIVRSFWVGYYRYFYPGWMHAWGIVLFAPSIGMALAVLFSWIARLFRSRPIMVFFLAAGVEAGIGTQREFICLKSSGFPCLWGLTRFRY